MVIYPANLLHKVVSHGDAALAVDVEVDGRNEAGHVDLFVQGVVLLGLLSGGYGSAILDVVRTGGHSAVALGAPGDGSATEEENVGDGAPQRVRAICVRGVVVAVDRVLYLGQGKRAEVALEPIVAGAGEISQ